MKIYLKFSAGELTIERKPMSEERFQWICYLLFAAIGAGTFLGFLWMMTR